MSPIRNEQLKLSATFLNGAGIAVFAVGGISPLVSVFYTGSSASTDLWLVVTVCTLAAGVLHFMARAILGGLE